MEAAEKTVAKEAAETAEALARAVDRRRRAEEAKAAEDVRKSIVRANDFARSIARVIERLTVGDWHGARLAEASEAVRAARKAEAAARLAWERFVTQGVTYGEASRALQGAREAWREVEKLAAEAPTPDEQASLFDEENEAD